MHAIVAMLKSALTKALHTWQSVAADYAKERRKIQHTMQKMMHSGLARSFVLWRAQALKQKMETRRLTKFTTCWLPKVVIMAMVKGSNAGNPNP